jgi:hypothetical protein
MKNFLGCCRLLKAADMFTYDNLVILLDNTRTSYKMIRVKVY